MRLAIIMFLLVPGSGGGSDVSRTRADLAFLAMWEVVKHQLDYSLKESYESQVDNGVKLLTWLKSKRAILSLFVEPKHIDAIIKTEGDFTQAPASVQAIVNATKTGTCMFKNVWLACARELYVSEVKQSLTDLEHNGYAADELQSFREVMSQKVARLKSQGHRRMTWEMKTEMLGEEITLNMDDPNDEWMWRLHARVKSIAINTRQLKPLWYEEILVPQGTLADAPSHLVLPDSMVEQYMAARGTVADLLAGVSEMDMAVKIVSTAADTLLDLDKSFECDLAFLNQSAGAMLKNRVHQEVLGALPGPKNNLDFDEAIWFAREGSALLRRGLLF